MAIEDIIWAKNRHMFGGIEPPDVKKFNLTQHYDDKKNKPYVRIYIELPDDLVVPSTVEGLSYDASICTVGGGVIRKSISGYPKDEFDGELVADIPADNLPEIGYIVDEDVNGGKTYYYSSFVYSTQGVWRASKTADITLYANDVHYFYGYDLDTTNSDPATRVTYPSDVDNASYTPAVLNNLNDWNITPGTKFMPQPCMLKYDGTVGEYLDPNDYTKTVNGAASNVANSSYGGNAMMEWPKIYTKRWEEGGIYHFRCSDKIPEGEEDDWYCWCNYDVNNCEIEHFYTGIYNCSQRSTLGSNSNYQSISGKTFTTNTDFGIERDFAQKNGTDWDLEYLSDHLLIQDLLVMMGKSTNTQAVFGVGCFPDDHKTGYGDTLGMFSGVDNKLIIFGMENYWGSYGRRVLGWMFDSGFMYVKITKGNKDGSKVTDFATSNNDGYIESARISTDVYLKWNTITPWGRLPANNTGSATTYECDYFMKNTGTSYSSVTTTPITIGGKFSSVSTFLDNYLGAFYALLGHTNTGTGSFCTSRLSYKPTKQ